MIRPSAEIKTAWQAWQACYPFSLETLQGVPVKLIPINPETNKPWLADTRANYENTTLDLEHTREVLRATVTEGAIRRLDGMVYLNGWSSGGRCCVEKTLLELDWKRLPKQQVIKLP